MCQMSDESDQVSRVADRDEGAAAGVDLAAELEASKAAAEQLREQVLRAAAEAENVRRRAQRDVENAHKFAIEKFAAELLPVADSLERSVATARANGADGAAAAIADGVELSLKLFLDVLARGGIVQIDPHGEPFNPQFHEAVSIVESESAEPGSVVQVLQKGYTLNGRLMRAAMVLVAKAPAA
jgi:molecular chaperone GrpE